MGAFGVIIWILHYMGLYIQLNAAYKPTVRTEVDNHISGNGRFNSVGNYVANLLCCIFKTTDTLCHALATILIGWG